MQPLDESTSFGPLISGLQRDKVLGYIAAGTEQGATVVTGGKKWQEDNGGFYIEPTILTGCKPGMKVVDEEVRPLSLSLVLDFEMLTRIGVRRSLAPSAPSSSFRPRRRRSSWRTTRSTASRQGASPVRRSLSLSTAHGDAD